MPNGNIHAITTVALAGLSAAALHQLDPTPDITIAAVSGTLSGLILTPDLDVPTRSISQIFVRKRFGTLVGLMWKMWWLPYAILIPHRHWLSHFPLISTIVRLIFLGGLIGILTFLFRLISGNDHLFLIIYEMLKDFVLSPYGFAAFAGLALSDIGHYVLDRIF